MAAALEAKLIISAQDRTKATFDAILRRLDSTMERARGLGRATEVANRAIDSVGLSLGRVEHSLGTAARTMEAAARSMERAAAAMARARPPAGPPPIPGEGGGPRGHGHGRVIAGQLASGRPPGHIARHVVTDGAYGAGGVGGAVGAYVAFEAAEKVAEASAEREHERVRMQISDASLTDAQRKEIEKRAAVLSGRFPQVDGTSILHTLRNTRGITGSWDDAEALSDDVMRMRIVANAAKPGRDIEHETDQLLKAMELHGDTMKRADFHDAITKINKVLAVEGDTLGPRDIYMASKLASQALPTASRRFMYGVAPALEQDMGGARFGTSLAAFNRAFVDGCMDSRALKTALALKLIDPADVTFKGDKPIAVKSIAEGGHGFKDAHLAATDPDKFLITRLVPALKAAGITRPEDIAATTGVLLSNHLADQFVNAFLTQLPRIQKSTANFDNASDDPAGFIQAHDPQAAWQGLTNSLTNVAAATDASGHGVTAALNAVSAAMNDFAAKQQGAVTDNMKAVQSWQEAGGRRDEARQANHDLYGIDTADDLSKASPEQLSAARKKEIDDLQSKIVPAMLRLKGLEDEVAARKADRSGVLGWLGFGQPAGAVGDEATALKAQLAELQAALARLKSFETQQAQDEAAKRTYAHDHFAPVAAAAPAFPQNSTYAYAMGAAPPAPARSPYGGLDRGAAAGPIEAELKGSVDISSSFQVGVSSGFIEIVNKAQKIVSDNALIRTATGGDRGLAGMKVGAGASDTGPAGRKP